MTQEASFKNFYLDPSLPGHSLLEPSILVGEAYGRVFSPIEESGCGAFAEVITRIALFVILPIGALFSALLIPFGLAVKGLSLCCAPDPEPMPLSHQGPAHTPDAKPRGSLPRTRTPPLEDSIFNPTAQPSHPLDDIILGSTVQPQPSKTDAAWSILKDIRGELERIDRRDIIPGTLANIREWLQNAPEIREVLKDAPLKRTDTSHPLYAFMDEYEKLILWIDALQFHFDFFGKAVRESDRSWLAEGEISVADNGDCLFEASHYHSEMNDSFLADDVQSERFETVKWIREHYEADKELQRHLVNSMVEHFFSKSERLEAERQSLLRGLSSGLIDKSEENNNLSFGLSSSHSEEFAQQILGFSGEANGQRPFANTKSTRDASKLPEDEGEKPKTQVNIRLQQIGKELEIIEAVYIPAFQKAMGPAHRDEFNFEPASHYVEAYFYDLSQKGEHASRAELYALSHRRKVCFKIHAKRPEKHEVDVEPYITFNPHFESSERPARHFTHSRNHYNPYYPPSSK